MSQGNWNMVRGGAFVCMILLVYGWVWHGTVAGYTLQ